MFKLPAEDHWRTDNTCSFCGSLNPEDFMQAAAHGALLVPTDKSYKVYVGDARIKFYFQHLSKEQMTMFIQLLNDRKINFAFPGHFYVLPFFVRAKDD